MSYIIFGFGTLGGGSGGGSGGEINPEVIQLSDYWRIASLGYGWDYTRLLDNQRAVPLFQLYNDDGTSTDTMTSFSAAADIVFNDENTETEDTATFEQSFASFLYLVSVSVQTDVVSDDVDLTITVTRDDITEDIPLVSETITTDADGFANFTFPTRPALTSGDYDFTVSAVNLRGSTVGGTFIPNMSVNAVETTGTPISTDDETLNPTWIALDSNDSNITYGGFRLTGRIRRRDLSTGDDTFFQSSATTPIPDEAGWTDWQNRETLVYS